MKTQTIEYCNDCKDFNYEGNMCLDRNKEVKECEWCHSFYEFIIPEWCELPDVKD